MAIKYNLPNTAGGINTNNLTNEAKVYTDLFNDINRTTTGDYSFTSTSSGITYSTNDYPDDINVYQKGAEGMINLLLTYALSNYNISATDYNNKVDAADFNNTVNPMQTLISELQIQSLQNTNDITSLLLQSEIDGKIVVGNNSKFYITADSVFDPFSSSIGSVDNTNGFSPSITAGTNTLTISQMITGRLVDYKVGQEITLQDANNSESLIIQSKGINSLTFTTNIINSYPNGAIVYRSNIAITTDNNITIGNSLIPSFVNRASTTSVIPSTYDLSGNNGRKMTTLSNGYQICIAIYSSTLYVYQSVDNGGTFTQLCRISGVQLGASITSIGTKCVILFNSTNQVYINSAYNYCVYSVTFEATTVQNVDLSTTKVLVDSQTYISNNLSIANDGSKFYGTACTRNQNYPNSYNVRYYVSNDFGKTWFITQVGTDNVSSSNSYNPCLIINALGYPVIVCQRIITGTNFIYSYQYNGAVWTPVVIYSDNTYSVINPCAIRTSDGNINVVFQARDSVDKSYYNIFYTNSADNGTSYVASIKITPAGITYNQTVPSITADYNNNLYVQFQGRNTGYYDQIREIICTSGTWGNINNLTSNTSGVASNPSTCDNYTYFLEPLSIFQNTQSWSVRFYGIFYALNQAPLLSAKLRINITPSASVTNISAFTYANNLLTVAGSSSIVDSSANENFVNTTDSTSNVNGLVQTQSLGTVGTAANKVTLKLSLTRSVATNNVEITKIIGGVS